MNDAKWTVFHSFLASALTAFLFLTFVSCHAGIFSSCSHSFSTAAFASGIFMAWSIGKFCAQDCSWLNEFIPLPAMWSSWFLFLRPFRAYPHRFAGLNDACVFCPASTKSATGFPVLASLPNFHSSQSSDYFSKFSNFSRPSEYSN